MNDKQLTPEEINYWPIFTDWQWNYEGKDAPTHFEAFKAGVNYTAQQTAAKDEEIAKLQRGEKIWDGMYQSAIKENSIMAERIKELEDKVKNDGDPLGLLQQIEWLRKNISESETRIAELEKVNEQLGEHAAMLELAIDNEKAGSGLIIEERDQAFDLLEQVEHEESEWKIQRHKLLSSRENKKQDDKAGKDSI